MVGEARGGAGEEVRERIGSGVGASALRRLVHDDLEIVLAYPKRRGARADPFDDYPVGSHRARGGRAAGLEIGEHFGSYVIAHALESVSACGYVSGSATKGFLIRTAPESVSKPWAESLSRLGHHTERNSAYARLPWCG